MTGSTINFYLKSVVTTEVFEFVCFLHSVSSNWFLIYADLNTLQENGERPIPTEIMEDWQNL